MALSKEAIDVFCSEFDALSSTDRTGWSVKAASTSKGDVVTSQVGDPPFSLHILVPRIKETSSPTFSQSESQS